MIDIPELKTLCAGADHVDVKSAESDVTLREFVAGALSWSPGWVKALFGARAVVARLLRLQHPGGSDLRQVKPDDIPFTPGGKFLFWTVTDAEEDRFIVLEASDTHLAAHLAIVADHGRFHAVTVVHYRNWTGPVYFALVRPFHHIIVRGMVKAGAHA